MPRPRRDGPLFRISRGLCLGGLLVGCGALAGCEDHGAPGPPSEPTVPELSSAQAMALATSQPPPSALPSGMSEEPRAPGETEAKEESESSLLGPQMIWHELLATRPAPEELLAFTRFRFAHITDTGLSVHATNSFEIVAEPKAEGLHHVVALVGGAMLTFGPQATFRLSATDTRFAKFPRLSWLGDPVIFPHPRTVTHFFVHYARDASAFEYDLEREGSVLLPLQQMKFPNLDGPVTLLPRGDFLYVAKGELARLGLSHREPQLAPVPKGIGTPVRLVASGVVGEAWLLDGSKTLYRLQVAGKPKLVGTCRLDATPIQAAAVPNRFAVVLVHQKPGVVRRWELRVIDDRCHELLAVALPGFVEAGPQSVAAELRGRDVALSPDGKLVGVGGRRWVRVYRVSSGHRLFGDP